MAFLILSESIKFSNELRNPSRRMKLEISSLVDKIADPNGARGLGEGIQNTGGEKRFDPDEFFRQFPGGFLFFPVVTSSGGSGLQTIRSKIFTTTPVDFAATGVADRRGEGRGEIGKGWWGK